MYAHLNTQSLSHQHFLLLFVYFFCLCSVLGSVVFGLIAGAPSLHWGVDVRQQLEYTIKCPLQDTVVYICFAWITVFLTFSLRYPAELFRLHSGCMLCLFKSVCLCQCSCKCMHLYSPVCVLFLYETLLPLCYLSLLCMPFPNMHTHTYFQLRAWNTRQGMMGAEEKRSFLYPGATQVTGG